MMNMDEIEVGADRDGIALVTQTDDTLVLDRADDVSASTAAGGFADKDEALLDLNVLIPDTQFEQDQTTGANDSENKHVLSEDGIDAAEKSSLNAMVVAAISNPDGERTVDEQDGGAAAADIHATVGSVLPGDDVDRAQSIEHSEVVDDVSNDADAIRAVLVSSESTPVLLQ